MQDKYQEVAVTIVVASFLFMVLSGISLFLIVFYQRKRQQHIQEMFKAQLEAQEMTFHQIAGEIHDNVGQLLNTVKNMLGILMLDRSLLSGEDKVLASCMETLAQAMAELRSLSKSLNKEWLGQFNILENLQIEVERMSATRLVGIKLQAGVKEVPLKTDEQIMLFRIIQEALQNCLKHSGADDIQINMQHAGATLKIEIADNGVGFDPENLTSKGMGLRNMQNRTRILGGSITWESKKNAGGTRVNIALPVKT